MIWSILQFSLLASLALARPPTARIQKRDEPLEVDQPIPGYPALNAQSTTSTAAASQATQSSSTGYTCFGNAIEGYPDISAWPSFDQMWSANLAKIKSSNQNNAEVVSAIQSAIPSIAGQSGVPEQFILAIMMQESGGNAKTKCGDVSAEFPNGRSCGLMQIQGSSAFDPSDISGSVSNMINDGVMGTANHTAGLSVLLTDPGCGDAVPGNENNVFLAARCYNSGTAMPEELDAAPSCSTPSYVNDIANRIMNGWHSQGTCAQNQQFCSLPCPGGACPTS